MRKMILATLIALVVLCASAVAEEIAEEMWDKIYGGPGNDLASEVQVTEDKGYVIVGVTDSYGSGDGRRLADKDEFRRRLRIGYDYRSTRN